MRDGEDSGADKAADQPQMAVPGTAGEVGPDGLRFGPLTGSLGFLLRLAQLSAFDHFYDTFGALDVRPGELSALLLIGRNPGVRQGVLARNMMVKRAHMTKMVRAMEREGLVRRTVPEHDRRAVELWLTEAGEARVAGLLTPFLDHETRAHGRLNRRETAQLKRLLRAYLDIPEPMPDPEKGTKPGPSEESG